MIIANREYLIGSKFVSQFYRYFKFRPINKYLIESLVNPSWYFASPAELNDPFDCNVNLKAAFERAAEAATLQRKKILTSIIGYPNLLNDFAERVSKLGVCAFSLRCDETLLWSHYADRHRGVCILYEVPDEFINAENKFLGVSNIKYGSDALDEMLNTCPLEMEPFLKDLLKIYLTTKSPTWSYEAEFRAIRNTSGVLPISGNYIKQICFGMRSTAEDVALIEKLARAYTSCTKFTKMNRDRTDFGFNMEQLDV